MTAPVKPVHAEALTAAGHVYAEQQGVTGGHPDHAAFYAPKAEKVIDTYLAEAKKGGFSLKPDYPTESMQASAYANVKVRPLDEDVVIMTWAERAWKAMAQASPDIKIIGTVGHTLVCSKCGAEAHMLICDTGKVSLDAVHGWTADGRGELCPVCAKAKKGAK